MLGHHVPIPLEHPLQQLALLAVAEDGGSHRGVLLTVLLEVRGGVAPVRVRGMVVHHVVVLVPHVVVAIQDRHRVHVLVTGVRLLDEGMPQVGDGAKQDAALHVREDPVDQSEHRVPPQQQQRDAIVGTHAQRQLLNERPLLALDEQGQRAQAGPIQSKPGHVQEERKRVRAVQVQIRVDVVDIVVPAVMDLHMRDPVVPRHDTVEGPNPPFRNAIEDLEDAAKEPTMGMPLLMSQRVDVREELQARAHTEQVVDAQCGKLQAVVGVPLERPEEERGGEDPEEEHPGQIRVVPGVPQHEAAQRPRDRAHELRQSLAQPGAALLAPLGLQQFHGRDGRDDLDGHDWCYEEHFQNTPREGNRVGKVDPRERPPVRFVQPLPQGQQTSRKLGQGPRRPMHGVNNHALEALERWQRLPGIEDEVPTRRYILVLGFVRLILRSLACLLLARSTLLRL
mmetsp:Transcript_150024/g.482158  ORF Transcript_150024/g.482158 Transcript_150024/m.482158 type:complete len:452 (-) Transcript_150024:535-1890(-)